MKTTLELSPELLKRAKQQALDSGTSLKAVVEAALHAHLGVPTLALPPLKTVVAGEGLVTTSARQQLQTPPSGEYDLDSDAYWLKRFGFIPPSAGPAP
jgi:hypothetical protein